MEIVEYQPQYRQAYIDFNKAWIEKWFVLEPADVEILENVETHIANGGMAFFAISDGEPISTGLIEHKVGSNDPGLWEFNKFASDPNKQGHGAGSAIIGRCIEYAKEHGAQRIMLVSNTRLKAAQHLYRKFGFREVPMTDTTFERCNIQYIYEIAGAQEATSAAK
jgi:GNAT superfamily N-acetyltransferase